MAIAFGFVNTVLAEPNMVSDDWFQIDTIIFEYLEPDISEDVGSEGKKSYPKNLIAVEENLKAVKEGDGFEVRKELLSMENGYSKANTTISYELENESARRFNKELIETLIKQQSENQSEGSYEETPGLAEGGFRSKIIKDLVFQLNPSADGQLAFKEVSALSDLREIKGKIERSAGMRVLSYKSWIQPIGADQKSIMLLGGARQEENYEIEGFITLYRKRFLHVVTDLWFTKSATKNEEGINFSNSPPREPVNGSLVKDASNSSALKMFMMKQKRRARANELHYLDHPAFGLILKIKRV